MTAVLTPGPSAIDCSRLVFVSRGPGVTRSRDSNVWVWNWALKISEVLVKFYTHESVTSILVSFNWYTFKEKT
jgi:hypothetical protein